MTYEEFKKRYIYDIHTDLLGEGGFGRVYKAYDSYEHEDVALKMQSVNPNHPELRLRNEVDKVAQYVHKNIARYKTCYTFPSPDGEMDVAVMKYYADGNLSSVLKNQILTVEQRADILCQILEGIAFLHSHDIIHRDLKPQNILVVRHNGRIAPLITDFGISKKLEVGQSSSVFNSFMGGTFEYASPEQLAERSIRKNTDLWSFGVIVYQMFTGELPYSYGDGAVGSVDGRMEYIRQLKSGKLPDGLWRVPEPWQTIIRKCLVVDNTKRLAHAEDCFKILKYQSDGESVKCYQVGDYYNRDGKQGVVFEVWNGGRNGKIVSLDQARKQWCTDSQYNKKIATEAKSETDGKANTDRIMRRSDSSQYPAFVWCRNKGNDWYLPVGDELQTIRRAKDKINNTMSKCGGESIRTTGLSQYWTSTEYSKDSKLCAWYHRMDEGNSYGSHKYNNFYVRAVSAF